MDYFGFIYVVTTKQYKEKKIFKIGCTKNLKERLKSLNCARLKGDRYFVIMHWRSFQYFKIESEIHQRLQGYKLHNEFYKCTLETIENALKNYLQNTSLFEFITDFLYVFGIEYEVSWNSAYFSLKVPGKPLEINCSDKIIINYLCEYMTKFDKFNLYKFVSSNEYDKYICFLKNKFAVTPYDYNLSDIMANIKLNSSYDSKISMIINSLFHMNI